MTKSELKFYLFLAFLFISVLAFTYFLKIPKLNVYPINESGRYDVKIEWWDDENNTKHCGATCYGDNCTKVDDYYEVSDVLNVVTIFVDKNTIVGWKNSGEIKLVYGTEGIIVYCMGPNFWDWIVTSQPTTTTTLPYIPCTTDLDCPVYQPSCEFDGYYNTNICKEHALPETCNSAGFDCINTTQCSPPTGAMHGEYACTVGQICCQIFNVTTTTVATTTTIPRVCTEYEYKTYTCLDGTVVNECQCLNNKWDCVANVADRCPKTGTQIGSILMLVGFIGLVAVIVLYKMKKI